MSLSESKNSATQSSGRRIWRWIGYGVLAVLAVFVMGAIYLWSQRYSLLEDVVRDQLADRGIESELRIERADQHEAVIRGLKLRDQGETFFSADRIKVEYAWRDALKGQVNYVEIDKPFVKVTVDESGNVQDGWYLKQQGRSSAGQDFQLPPRGVVVRNGAFDVTSPYGQVTGDASTNFKSLEELSADIELDQSQIKFGDFAATLSGPVKLMRNSDGNTVEPDMQIADWRYKDFSGTHVDIKGVADIGRSKSGLVFSGDATLASGAMDIGFLQLGSGDVQWSGDIELGRQTGGNTRLNGKWAGDFTAVTVIDDQRRRNLAETLTLNSALTNTPIAQNFAERLTTSLYQLMNNGRVVGEGTVNKPDANMQISLDAPLLVSSGERTLSMTQETGQLFYNFDADAQAITLNFDAAYDGPYAVMFSGAELVMDSTSGRDIYGVQAFNAGVSTQNTWRAKLPDGRPVRLAPLKAKMAYINSEKTQRIDMSGAIDYDGDIPGGYVKGLTTRGDLGVNLVGAMRVGYAPSRGSKISIDEFFSITEWHGRDIIFSLDNTRSLFARNPNGSGRLSADLSDVSAEFYRTTVPQDMTLTYDTARIAADISEAAQDWKIDGQGVVMTSETLPSPGTYMETDVLDLTVQMREGAPLQFTMATPLANTKTQLIEGKGLKVSGGGTPADYTLNYENGRVKFLNAPLLPVMPMTGDVHFSDNRWTGEAVTYLPMAENTPIDVDYTFENGVGTAQVDIVDLSFRPSGLQPQYLIPALKGKVADVRGLASAQIDLSFGVDQPLQSSGTAQLKDMALGTLPGPVTGINSEMRFSSFFPLQTDGEQFLTLETFDPGLPLDNGEVRFELVPDGVDISSARWPLGDGFVSLDPTQWRYTAPENRMTLRVEDVSLGQFLNNIGNGNLTATGNINGILPVVISGINVDVVDGRLFVKDGGVIQYRSEQTDNAAAQSEHAQFAFDALKNFEYEELEAIMNGPLDGNILIRMLFDGSNPDVLGGAQFKFNVSLEGELLNIARSFNLGQQIGAEIVKSIRGSDPVPDAFLQTD